MVDDNSVVDKEKASWAHHAAPRRSWQAGLPAPLQPGDGIPVGRVGSPRLVYDEEKNLFRFRDGRFAFSYLIAYAAIVSLVRESLFPEVGE
jgi:hypothetical protein